MNIIFPLREVNFKGWIYLDITKVWEPMHRCKILSLTIGDLKYILKYKRQIKIFVINLSV
jgi:hypothetical protein